MITPMRWRTAAVTVVALPPLAATCGSSGTSISRPATTAAPVLPGGAAHVHGIVRSRGGELLIGTHAGLFTPRADGTLARVGDTADYMGLAALPTGALLSSGHPAPGSTEPNPLGLRISQDGGRTWTTSTQVPRDDYHVIEAGAGRVYAVGSDGGMYAGSARMALARVGGARRDLIDLAVKPGSGTSLIASTPQGLVRSTDGDPTWANAGDEVGHISWTGSNSLFMVDAEGGAFMSTDEGTSWIRRGTLGAPPAALLATSPTALTAADHDGRILQSSDGGRTWS